MYLGKELKGALERANLLKGFIGKWIKHTDGGFVYVKNYTDSIKGDVAFGFGFKPDGVYVTSEEDIRYSPLITQLERVATMEEMKPLLIARAKEIGYRPGNHECLAGDTYSSSSMNTFEVERAQDGQYEVVFCNEDGSEKNYVFEEGEWADVIENTRLSYRGLEVNFISKDNINIVTIESPADKTKLVKFTLVYLKKMFKVMKLSSANWNADLGGSECETGGYQKMDHFIVGQIPFDINSLALIIEQAEKNFNN